MKRLTVILLFPLTFIACSKKSSSSSGSQGTMSATVGSAAFAPTATYGAYYSSLSVILALGMVPNGSDTTFLQVSLPYPPTLNTTFSTDSTLSGLSYYTASGSKAYDAYTGFGKGLFTITLLDSVNHKISGTFSGTLKNDLSNTDSIVITNGKFSTAYTVE